MVHAALTSINQRISAACSKVGRIVSDVSLVAVSKTFEVEHIRPVAAAGQRVFGENRVQEAKAKFPILRQEFSGIELHLIGPLQSNKAAEAVALFDCIQSIDRPKIADALAKEMQKQNKVLDYFIQVNTGDETQKAGVALVEADRFIEACVKDFGLNIMGLMCIPPLDDDAAKHFKLLHDLNKAHKLPKLSMGMSADFELAIASGATHVRVGSALFGKRD